MSVVKLFRVSGQIRKPNFQTLFKKEIHAVKPEDAVEEVYQILGSKHRVKRFYIKIEKIEEITEEKAAEKEE
jgi:large subunit ribosomal protein LX